jgi:hypothetical protein
LRKRRPDDFEDTLDAVSRGIKDPVAKLRFLRAALTEQSQAETILEHVPGRPLRRGLARWLHVESLRYMKSGRALGSSPRLDAATRTSMVLGRVATAAVALGLVGALASLVTLAYRFWRPEPGPIMAAPSLSPAPSEIPAFLPAGVAPTAVWMVEKGEGWEQYSNGLRIDSTYAVAGEPRRYRLYDPVRGIQPDLYTRPSGILFHTSESDVWPLQESFNETLRDSSHKLLKYVKRHKLYHYLIDRFGRVYRVVDEEGKANHAGHGVWEENGRLHLHLNHSFLGVSFETRWEGGRALPITQAQFAAGRNLTDYLRQRWQITREMCVTHGLTSVNPKKHLIGHHLDWARGFPFEAFGLPDQYRRTAPSVAAFGFGYDDDFLKVLGEPWEGVRAAERALADEAARQGRTVDQVRIERQALFHLWLGDQARAEAVSGPASNLSGG